MVNGTEPTIHDPHDLTHAQRHQAELFMKVLIKQKHTASQIANILRHMGVLFVDMSDKAAKRLGHENG